MSSYKILVEPAKSSKGTCKVCSRSITQDSIRINVRDDRKFRQYIKQHRHQDLGGEGMSRGYFETPEGCISIQKYFVHLSCYTPIHPHPFEKQYFKLSNFKARHIADFDHWLQQRSTQQFLFQQTKKNSRRRRRT